MLWRIQLLGNLTAVSADRVVTRFRTRKTAALLAYLALHLGRSHPRDYLADLFWPEADAEAARRSLRVALASLRGQLEPPPLPAGAVLVAQRDSVALNPETVGTDLLELEGLLDLPAADPAAVVARLAPALSRIDGELLAGLYEEWVFPARERVSQRLAEAGAALAAAALDTADPGRALPALLKLSEADPLREELHQAALRVMRAAGQHEAAERFSREVDRRFRVELGEEAAPPLPRQPPPAAPAPPAQPGPVRVEGSAAADRFPIFLDRFFGREEELDRLECLLAPGGDSRLVTLTGPGGSGKTRLAVEAARRLRPAYPGRVTFVPLADLRDARRIGDSLVEALRLPPSPSASPLEQAVQALAGGPSLLVLDNLEQVLPDGAATVQTLLQRLPELRCLVTSRERLLLPGEAELPVAPLPLPAEESLECLAGCPSIRLFADRAQAARPDFQVTARNAAAVAGVCARLEGIPLAIELAAARAGTLSVGQILDRLVPQYRLLETRSRDRVPRHRSLWAAVDWSYDLLSGDLQRFFARLAVFRGGWTVEAAETVAAGPESTLPAAEALTRLRGVSLVQLGEAEPEVRYRMLETLREYADERLDEDDRLLLQRRHMVYFLRAAEELAPVLGGRNEGEAQRALATELDNFRAALQAACRAECPADRAAGLRLAVALREFWDRGNLLDEGRAWTADLLEAAGDAADPGLRADALYAAGYLAERQTDGAAALPLLEESAASYAALGDPVGEGLTLVSLAQVRWLMRHEDYPVSRELLARALALLRDARHERGVAMALFAQGRLMVNQFERPAARPVLAESVALFQRLGDLRGAARGLYFSGVAAYWECDYPAAAADFRASLDHAAQSGNRSDGRYPLLYLGQIARDELRWEAALAATLEALELARIAADLPLTVACLEFVGNAHLDQGDYAEARGHFQQALEQCLEVNARGIHLHTGTIRISLAVTARCLGLRDECREHLRQGAEVIAPDLDCDRTATVLRYVALLIARCRPARAARLFGLLEITPEGEGLSSAAARNARPGVRARECREVLGEARFLAEWERGRGGDREEVYRRLLDGEF